MDQYDRGLEAAELMGSILNHKVSPTKATVYLPFAVNIFCQNSSEEPFKGFISFVESIRNKAKVLAVSVFVGFPYADVPQMGSAISVMTNDDLALAKKYAEELAQHWLSLKKQFDPILPSVADSVTQMKNLPGPICALDQCQMIATDSN